MNSFNNIHFPLTTLDQLHCQICRYFQSFLTSAANKTKNLS